LSLTVWESPLDEKTAELVYVRDETGRLWRRETENGRNILVAAGVEAFTVIPTGPDAVRMELLLNRAGLQRRLVVMGEIP
jgi:hypothetical protein